VTHIEGHVPPGSPFSPRQAFKRLKPVGRLLAQTDPETAWQQDTRALPRVLARARYRLRAFAERELATRALAMDAALHLPDGATSSDVTEILHISAKAGLLTDLLPRPFGSAPVGQFRYPLAWYQALRTEELAWGCGGLMLLLSAHHLGAAPLLLSADVGAMRRFLLPAYRQIRRGQLHLFAYAITEPGAGSDAEESHGASMTRPGTVARRVPGGWSLSGRKIFISGGDLAHSITVFAALENEGLDSWTCFLVKHDMPGFKVVRRELKMGMRASAAAELEFENVFVPDDHIIGGLRQGWGLNRAVLNISRIPVAGMAVGFARAATDVAIDFACRHRLAGKELIHYQEVQLALAQMMAETAAIRSLVWQVARRSFRPRQDKAAMCKFYATDTAVKVCEMALDLLGNHGMLHCNRVEKIYRDARLTQIFEGTNEINRLAVIEDHQEHFLAGMAG